MGVGLGVELLLFDWSGGVVLGDRLSRLCRDGVGACECPIRVTFLYSAFETFLCLESVFPAAAFEDGLCSYEIFSDGEVHQHTIVRHGEV